MKAMADSRPNEFELIARLTRDLPSRPDVDQAVGDEPPLRSAEHQGGGEARASTPRRR